MRPDLELVGEEWEEPRHLLLSEGVGGVEGGGVSGEGRGEVEQLVELGGAQHTRGQGPGQEGGGDFRGHGERLWQVLANCSGKRMTNDWTASEYILEADHTLVKDE